MEIRQFLLERYYGQYEFTTPRQLSASDCESLSIGELMELAAIPASELFDLRMGYTETRGAPALRDEIAQLYPRCTADDVLVCNAPQEAIFLSMHAMLAPGDRVVVMTPCYQSLKDVAGSIGCEVVEWALVDTERGWRLDLERLDDLLSDETRLLVTNAPHNPTGYLPSRAEWKRIAGLVEERDARWFSDEMYRGLEPVGDLALEPGASCVPGALSLWGTSKSFGCPGLRIGWLACTDAALLTRIEELKDYTSICSNAPGELLARAALLARDELLQRNRERIAAHRTLVDELCVDHADLLRWHAPIAGPVALARIEGETASAHAGRVRTEAGALLVPGKLFDLDDHYLRIGLGRADFPDAIERWRSVLERL